MATPAPRSPARASTLAVLAVGLGLATLIVATWWQGSRAAADSATRLASLEQQVADVEQTLHLMRLEQSVDGKGIGAVLEQLSTYSPLLAQATLSDPSYRETMERVEQAVAAARAIGPEAYPSVYDAFLAAGRSANEEERRWLLRTALAIDPVRGLDLVTRIVRNRSPELQISQRLRWLAADELLAHDVQRAQHELRQILLTESARGVNPQFLGAGGIAPAGSQTGFHNFVGRYLQSEDPQAEVTLTQVIAKMEHDRMTKQECVKALGSMGAKGAVPFIKKLYDDPPEIQGNPLFLNHCIEAIALIEGSRACEWLQEQYRNATHPLVLEKIKAKMKELCL